MTSMTRIIFMKRGEMQYGSTGCYLPCSKAQKIPLQWKGARLCWTGGQVVLGKELNAGEKVKRWEKELNTAKGGGSERASGQAAVEQGSNGQLHQGLPQTCKTWEMCKTCKIAKHVKLAQSCESLHVQVGKIWPQMKMIEVKSKTRFLVSTLNRSFINFALFNTDICPQQKKIFCLLAAVSTSCLWPKRSSGQMPTRLAQRD